MKRISCVEWFEFDSPIGEPNTFWYDDQKYEIERKTFEDGKIIWFGLNVNWEKLPGKNWTILTVADSLNKINDDSIYCGECELPIYEKMYQKYFCRDKKLNRILGINE